MSVSRAFLYDFSVVEILKLARRDLREEWLVGVVKVVSGFASLSLDQ